MALSKEQIAKTYPLPVYNYKVEIYGSDGKAETVGFSEVSGLNITHETTSYAQSPTGKEKGPQWMYMPAQSNAVNITLKKGFVAGGVSASALFKWINSIQLNRVDKKDISVHLCNEEGNSVVSWTVKNAFPTKLEAPSFTAESNDVAIETMELMADEVTIKEG